MTKWQNFSLGLRFEGLHVPDKTSGACYYGKEIRNTQQVCNKSE